MTTYEKLVDGVVVERVVPIDGDHSDTELGCMALDYTGGDGWRREGQVVEQPSDVPAEPGSPTALAEDEGTTETPAEPAKPARSKTDGS